MTKVKSKLILVAISQEAKHYLNDTSIDTVVSRGQEKYTVYCLLLILIDVSCTSRRTNVLCLLKSCIQRTFLLANTWCFMAMGADGLQIVMSHLLLLGKRC